MELGLEKLYHFLQSRNQQNRLTHVICEARGKLEDRDLELEFSHVGLLTKPALGNAFLQVGQEIYFGVSKLRDNCHPDLGNAKVF